MKLAIDFKNGFGCILDKIESYEIKNNTLKVRFTNKCVRKFDAENIEKMEEIEE